MKYVRQETRPSWVITLEPGEPLTRMAGCIARASFETAGMPDGMGLLHYDANHKWEEVRDEVRTPSFPDVVLQMDYVAGRRCKTTVVRVRGKLLFHPGDEREADGHLILTVANDYMKRKKRVHIMREG